MEKLQVIAFTHHNLSLEEIGKLHIEAGEYTSVLPALKETLKAEELMYLSTCNRVELILKTDQTAEQNIQDFLTFMKSRTATITESLYTEYARVLEGLGAVRHLFEVTASLDSMVVGEREIITQVRKAFEDSKEAGTTGDTIRLLVQKAIESGKAVFTQTNISARPVSVVSLAYRMLRDMNLPLDARVVMIGAGQTNKTMARFLHKHGFNNVHLFNRTLENARKLAEEVNGTAHSLDELDDHTSGVDLLVTCTGSALPLIDEQRFDRLRNGKTGNVVIVDLAIPADVADEVSSHKDVRYIGVESLKEIAERNMKERETEVTACKDILDLRLDDFIEAWEERKIELAMKGVPVEVKAIRKNAIEKVFAGDLEKLDIESREVLEKVIEYMEKKYISVPMKMAREIILDQKTR